MRALLALLLLLTGCVPKDEGPVASGDAVEYRLRVPVAGSSILSRLCLPPSGATRPLVLINHGSPPRAERRPGMNPAACNAEAVRWFLARGHAVGLPMLSARPDVAPGPAIIIGQSAGGWGVLALAAGNPAGVGAYVNMAGGRGGWRDNTPRNNCLPGALVRVAGEFGATSRGRMLWVYTENDSFFAPDLAGRMHAAFTAAGGEARMERMPAWGRDGHNMFFGNNGSLSWGPVVADFLASVSGGAAAAR